MMKAYQDWFYKLEPVFYPTDKERQKVLQAMLFESVHYNNNPYNVPDVLL